MNILGISSFYHDSAAAIIIDGRIAAAIEEERFSRIKHDNQFPTQAIQCCLRILGMTIHDIDAIAYYEKPLLKFERLLESFVDTYPRALKPFLQAIPDWLGNKIKVEDHIRHATGWSKIIHFIPHHLSHAAASYFTSPYSHAAVLTVDGVGEYQTTGLWHGKNEKLTALMSLSFPHSLGLLYSTFTAFLGFKVNEDEYKVMGLAAYGKPAQTASINKIIDVKEDGSFKLDLSYFSFREDFQMWSQKFETLFGQPRKPNDPILKRHRDLASSIQRVTETILFNILNHAAKETGEKNLCIGGGVALNALVNGKIYKHTPFRHVHILGTAGDSGAAIGAALFTNQLLAPQKTHHPCTSLYLGTSYTDDSIEELLNDYPVSSIKIENEDDLINKTTQLLAKGKIVGWFQGRCEVGPRALGNRSILSKPNPQSMKDQMNVIKRREQFRPFAGSILQEYVHDYFKVPEKNHYSPFMNFCFQVKEEKRKDLAAIVHNDSTCRIQTVSKENGRYYRLIQKFYEHTGIACILNTSFNLKGEPIVEHPRHAIEDFLKTEMDSLVIEDFLIEKIRRG